MTLQSFPDDDLVCTAAEPWFIHKTGIIRQSAGLFISKLAAHTDEFILIDLFAGSGFYTIGNKKERYAGIALELMRAGLPFNRWILCERDKNSAHALRVRTRRFFRDKQVLILEDALRILPEKLSWYIPRSSRRHRVSALCIVDSFSFEFPFEFVVQTLPLGINFIIPFTFCLNDQHNWQFYLHEQRDKLERYLGRSSKGTKLETVTDNRNFYKHLVRLYHQEMLMQGIGGSLSVHSLDSGLMELPSYYVGMFTAIPAVRNVQREVQQQMFTQFTLFDTP
ncbi:MAG: hypothetical protein NZM13_00435 [Cyclobacteriaceae bacterium]|nr:hypothetical protein [Cyclobacteriaceae bacterium]MDW8330252.1 hypothetical protein [Cyclobacteriaceae bacterium]